MWSVPGIPTQHYYTGNVVEIIFICHHLTWDWLDFNGLVFALMRCREDLDRREKKSASRINSSLLLVVFPGRCPFSCLLPRQLGLSMCFTVFALAISGTMKLILENLVRKGGDTLMARTNSHWERVLAGGICLPDLNSEMRMDQHHCLDHIP